MHAQVAFNNGGVGDSQRRLISKMTEPVRSLSDGTSLLAGEVAQLIVAFQNVYNLGLDQAKGLLKLFEWFVGGPWARSDANTDYVREYNAYDVVDCSGQKVGYAGVPFLPVSLLYRQCLLFPCLQRHTANKSFFFLQPLDHVNDMDDNDQQ